MLYIHSHHWSHITLSSDKRITFFSLQVSGDTIRSHCMHFKEHVESHKSAATACFLKSLMNCLTIRSHCVCVCATHVQGEWAFKGFFLKFEWKDSFFSFTHWHPHDFLLDLLHKSWYILTFSDMSSRVLTDIVSRCLQWGFPVDPPQAGPGSPWQQGGTATGPVYSAVGLPRSRGKRGCVQGLINHGCFGRDKQARPSRDAAAPAADGGKGQRRGGRCGGKGGGVVG